MEVKQFRALFFVLLLGLALAINGCGGGSSSSSPDQTSEQPPTAELTTVTGVAAAGAPLAGYVSLKDSQGNPTPAMSQLLESDGSFSFDVTGLVPPFYLKAEGVAGSTGYELHSLIGAAGTANVNPLTEAQVSAATGADPATLFNDPTIVNMTKEEINAALDKAAEDLVAMLKPLLEAWEAPTLNPITDVFVADGTGLDKLFDTTKVTTTSSGVEIIDKATNSTLAAANFDPASGGFSTTDTISTEEATTVTSVASDLDQIKIFLSEWLTNLKQVSADFATDQYINQQDAIADLAVDYVDAQSFGVNGGMTLDQEFSGILEDALFFSAIKSVAGVGIKQYDDLNDIYLLDIVLKVQINNTMAEGAISQSVAVQNIGGEWKITGNGYYMQEPYDALGFDTHINVYSDQTTEIVGLDMDLEDPQGVFSSAVVTGPGLPVGGIDFVANEFDWELQMDQSLMACARFNNDGTCREPEWNTYELTDAVINDMKQSNTYTITLQFGPESEFYGEEEVHIVTLAAKPLKRTELADTFYTVINNDFPLDTTWPKNNLIGQSYTFNYTTPTAYTPVVVGIEGRFEYLNSSVENWVDGIPLGSNLEKSLPLSSMPQEAMIYWGRVGTWTEDQFWREYQVDYNFRSDN